MPTARERISTSSGPIEGFSSSVRTASPGPLRSSAFIDMSLSGYHLGASRSSTCYGVDLHCLGLCEELDGGWHLFVGVRTRRSHTTKWRMGINVHRITVHAHNLDSIPCIGLIFTSGWLRMTSASSPFMTTLPEIVRPVSSSTPPV